MSCDKEDVSPKLDIVLIAPGEAGAGQRHLLDEHREAVAGGGQVELQVTFELCWPSWHQTGVEGEHTDHLLFDIDTCLASIGITGLVQPETRQNIEKLRLHDFVGMLSDELYF